MGSVLLFQGTHHNPIATPVFAKPRSFHSGSSRDRNGGFSEATV